ncbi:MAG TPA: hypothetical protein VN256_09385 [Pyrinomonadaceae bacterium]|nr:hypothetical protein [Pyrinomonadaceae bacterium]
MKMTPELKGTADRRRGERGAALISALLLAILLLTAGGALVLTTTMSATKSIDSTAEMQAYYGAEAGLQSTMNVMRGNIYSSADTPVVDFRKAVMPDESNADGDPATAANVARLSNWLSYDDAGSYPSRVVANGGDGVNAISYDVAVRDIDDSQTVSYSTAGAFEAGSSGCTVGGGGLTLTCGVGANTFTITYVPQGATTHDAYPAVNTGLGSFSITKTANGDINLDHPARFRMRINQTLPWVAYDTVNAAITGGGKAVGSTLKITFAGSTAKVDGTSFALCGGCSPLTFNYPAATGAGGATATALTSTLTAPEPRRILVRSTGYGPKGAIKRLEMVLNQSAFDFEAPAVLTMRGSDDGTPLNFDSGSSGSKQYTGVDHAGVEIDLPTFAVSGGDVSTANTGIKKHETVNDPELGYLDNGTLPAGTTVSTMQVSTPDFLETAQDARDALDILQASAYSRDRYYAPAAGTVKTVTAANTTPTGITFVDGDCELDGGSGLLVVTGTLRMQGNPNFSGVILVLGDGIVDRSGGGSGEIYGAMVVAAFDRNGTGGFTAPTYTTDGGGDSTFQYDSLAVSRALGAIGAASGGVREY